MTPATRRNVLRYGIAIDLVVLATGAGMLLPPSAAALFPIFGVAVLLSVWKGRLAGGATALVLSIAVLAAMFSVGTKGLALFALATLIFGVALDAMLRSGRQATPALAAVKAESGADLAARTASATGIEAAPPEALFSKETNEERTRLEAAFAEDQSLRREAEERAARLESERAEAERVQKETEERVAREREDAARALEERLVLERAEAERLRREAEDAARVLQEQLERERAEAERIRMEAQERLAAERAEAERARSAIEERVAREQEELARALQERLDQERTESERLRRETEERAAREREEVARLLQEQLAGQRAEAERVRRETEERLERERREIEERVARDYDETARALQARFDTERAEAERLRAQLDEREEREREQHEEGARERALFEAARAEAQAGAEKVRAEAELAAQARMDAERAAIEEKMRSELDQERESMRVQLEAQLAKEREVFARANGITAAKVDPQKPSLVAKVAAWFKSEPRPRTVNLNTSRIGSNRVSKSGAQPAPAARGLQPARMRKPRIVLLERRRATAETVAPKLRQRGIDVYVVERWVDAADEMLRVKPDAFFLDVEHPDFDIVHKTTIDKDTTLPIVLTGRSKSLAPNVRHAAFVARPYDLDEVVRIAQQAMSKPVVLLSVQYPRPSTTAGLALREAPQAKPPAAGPVVPPAGIRRETPSDWAEFVAQPGTGGDVYEVECFTCRITFDAVDADWCSCLAKERTLVCTNCLSCFCKAPPAFKEKFWVEAPPRLFGRKTVEGRKQQGALPANASPAQVTRPLVLTVEDDEDIQTIVQRVCANLGYGFVSALNGQDGLELAREYRPNLILSDAFMPKLDGREMCRQLKEEPEFAETRMVVMTGLYTDTKYRSEALKRFKVDDYISKPVAVTDLINLLQRHLEGVVGLPIQEDLHELHRRDVDSVGDDDEPAEDITLAQVLRGGEMDAPLIPEVPAVRKREGYEVSCFSCDHVFDATHAEWCRCVGRDNTLVCTQCQGCFCKAPAAYKERFWIDAPPSLFERKMIGSKRNLTGRANPPASEVKRPLILLVEDDENVQLIVRTVVTTMGFGFVSGANGQEGLSLAREYSPELILSDAFMPKLDGREMCRLLKEDPATARSKAIIMTGLYTDRKYRNEALDYFKVDDYVAKPLAVDDLIKLFKKHLPQEVATAH